MKSASLEKATESGESEVATEYNCRCPAYRLHAGSGRSFLWRVVRPACEKERDPPCFQTSGSANHPVQEPADRSGSRSQRCGANKFASGVRAGLSAEDIGEPDHDGQVVGHQIEYVDRDLRHRAAGIQRECSQLHRRGTTQPKRNTETLLPPRNSQGSARIRSETAPGRTEPRERNAASW